MGARQFHNWFRTLGAPEDPVATDTTSEWSLVSLMKALYLKISDGSFASAITGRAESFVALCQSAVLQTAAYARSAKASKISAAASAAASTTNAAAGLFTAGNAMLGQRAKKDRVLAQAAAASIIPETLVLGVQVYS